ncbi:hypothetical protein Zmor_020604 [Zophobas morio]|uniref:TIMELESS-interacting protein n=1 Tax=Zophobas morio TaxID=2755281 RepID=A0AA38MAI1_9CUCU|nr:hypothetical protein Zmor_020604 [Zophobas morio]
MSEDEDLPLDLDDELERFEEDNVEEAAEVQAENEEGETAEEANKTTVKPKRVIRNPQPKLNAETLKGKRGLATLDSYFDRVKFKGRGHEEQDLGVILKTYEYWCHRLFPKYPFDECISKIESLGTKKPVLTHIKKIRFDMLFDDKPILDKDDDSETDEIPVDQFNEILNDQFDELIQMPSLQPPVDVSEEQLERIRLNKERAEKIRREKLRQTMEIASFSQESHEPHEHVTLESDPSVLAELESQVESLESQEELGGNIAKSVEVSEVSQELTAHTDHDINMPLSGAQILSTENFPD